MKKKKMNNEEPWLQKVGGEIEHVDVWWSIFLNTVDVTHNATFTKTLNGHIKTGSIIYYYSVLLYSCIAGDSRRCFTVNSAKSFYIFLNYSNIFCLIFFDSLGESNVTVGARGATWETPTNICTAQRTQPAAWPHTRPRRVQSDSPPTARWVVKSVRVR